MNRVAGTCRTEVLYICRNTYTFKHTHSNETDKTTHAFVNVHINDYARAFIR